MDVSSIEADVCKVVTSLGFSKDRTHAILNGLSKSLRNNGPEFLIGRLNSLRDYYVDPEEHSFPAWIAKKRRKDGILRPKGWLGQVVGANTDSRTVVTLLSTVSKAVTLDQPSHKQLSKWKDAVCNPPEPTGSLLQEHRKWPIPPGRKTSGAWFPLSSFESQLRKEWETRPFFGPDSIGGTSIPFGDQRMSIKHDNGKPHLGDMFRAYEVSIIYAPSSAWVFQAQTGFGISGLSTHKSQVTLNALRKGAPDSKVKPKKGSGRPAPPPKDYPIGSISFLQQPSGKLRTVANPNRFVQWQNEPLQHVLAQWVNTQRGVFVTDQEAGIQWIQSRLKRGIHMTSCDLSSASDTLDYKQVTRLLKDPRYPLLKTSIEYFERCSSAPWFVPDPVAQEFLGSKTIRWEQGQPLGLAPSFALLTITNLLAARQAVVDVRGSLTGCLPYAIVGDDIVIETEFADAYGRRISELGGVANVEKSMSSDHRAEFCSRIIEPDRVYRLKPRFLMDNEPENILTYQDTSVRPRLRGWVRNMADRAGGFHLRESGLIPAYHSGENAKVDQKQLAHAVLALSKGETPDLQPISSMTMWMHGRSDRDPDYVHRRRRHIDYVEAERNRNKRRGFAQLGMVERWAMLQKMNEERGLPSIQELTEAGGRDLKSLLRKRKKGEKTVIEPMRSWYDMVTRMLAYDPSYRSHFPGLRYPRLGDKTDPVIDALLADTAREQYVTPRAKYDYRIDSRTVDENPVSRLSRLDRAIRKIKEGIVEDSSGTHFIREDKDGSLTILEDMKEGYSLYFVSPKGHESTRVTVPKVPLRDSAPSPSEKDEGLEL